MNEQRIKRKKRIRGRLEGSAERPRLSVFRSNKYIYAQIINDIKGHTVVASYGAKPNVVGEKLAKMAIKKKIKKVVFDRGGYKYHGKVKALADAARAAGLDF